MAIHDPFRYVLEYLDLQRNGSQIPRIQEKIREIQDAFLHTRFKDYEYSDPLFQAAYLVAYFPLYIEPIENLLTNTIRKRSNLRGEPLPSVRLGIEEKDKIDVSLYGGGAEPELFGFFNFIAEKIPAIQSVRSHYIDKHRWDAFRSFSNRVMIPDYWTNEYQVGNNLQIDLCDLFENDQALELVRNSDVHIMQNCATDLMNSFHGVNNYQEYMSKFFNHMKNGSLFIGIDVPLFDIPLESNPPDQIDVRGCFQRFARDVRRTDESAVLKSPSSVGPMEIAPQINREHELLNHFNPKRTVKFHSFIVRKGGSI